MRGDLKQQAGKGYSSRGALGRSKQKVKVHAAVTRSTLSFIEAADLRTRGTLSEEPERCDADKWMGVWQRQQHREQPH